MFPKVHSTSHGGNRAVPYLHPPPSGLAERLCTVLLPFPPSTLLFSRVSKGLVCQPEGVMKEVFLFPSAQSQFPQSLHPSPLHCIPGPGGVVGQGPEDGRNPQHWGMGFQKTPDPTASPLSAFGPPSEPSLAFIRAKEKSIPQEIIRLVPRGALCPGR